MSLRKHDESELKTWLTKAYGDTNGPLGFPMTSEAAKALEETLKDLPQECKDHGYKRVVNVGKAESLNEDERSDVSVIMADTLDRDREIFLMDGVDWSQFAKTGMPVTFAHDYHSLPVGRGLWFKRYWAKGVHGFRGKTQYVEAPEDWKGDWFPDAIWHLVSKGLLNGKSVGYIPTGMRAPAAAEIKARPELKNCEAVIAKCIILEWSIAPIAANPDALVQEVSTKIATPCGKTILDACELEAVKPEPTYLQQKEAATRELTAALSRRRFDPVELADIHSKTYLQLKEEASKRLRDGLSKVDIDTIVHEHLRVLRGGV